MDIKKFLASVGVVVVSAMILAGASAASLSYVNKSRIDMIYDLLQSIESKIDNCK